ncbi:hypothetical protein [Actinoplanes philippinensis]|uniref:hypothetical protein n=1 Tax=Actinoplanes philippinensis TaxID=35752 RepID=UPI0033D3E288
MLHNGTAVDIRSLEDFHDTLTARLAEVDAALRMATTLADRRPALGTFADAVRVEGTYTTLNSGYRLHLEQLREAILTTRQATGDIIANYRGAEESIQLSADVVADRLDGGVLDA